MGDLLIATSQRSPVLSKSQVRSSAQYQDKILRDCQTDQEDIHPTEDVLLPQAPLCAPSPPVRSPLQPIHNEKIMPRVVDEKALDEHSVGKGQSAGQKDSMPDIVQHAQTPTVGRPLANFEPIPKSLNEDTTRAGVISDRKPLGNHDKADRPHLDNNETQNDMASDHPPASMANSGVRFARWKSYKSFLPRYICKIPKEQLEIIESDDGWRPPLVGRRPLEQNVPKPVWDKAVAAAKITSRINRSLASPEREHGQENLSSAALQTAKPRPNSPTREADDDAEEDSSQPVHWSPTQPLNWPASPVRSEASDEGEGNCSPHVASKSALDVDGLPMDSPPMRRISFEEGRDCEGVKNHLVGEDSALVPATSPALTQQKQSPVPAQEPTEPNSSDTTKPRDLRAGDTEPAQSLLSDSGQETEQNSSLHMDSSTMGEVVVKRTPYPTKLDEHSQSTSSSTGISRIPASFQPRMIMQKKANERPPAALNLEQTESSFEENSSEDGELSQEVDQPHQATAINARQDARGSPLEVLDPVTLIDRVESVMNVQVQVKMNQDAPSGHEEMLVDSHSEREHVTRLKRKSLTNIDSSSGKRLRLMAPPAVPSRQSDQSYRSVEEKARQYRRELMKEVKTRPNEVEDMETSSPVVEAPTGRDCSEVLSQDGPDSIASEGQNHSTPITEQSALSFPKTRGGTTTSVGTMRTASNDSKDIYLIYKAAYPSYGGDSVQFENARQLIRTLRQAGKAPHPSLWDDFIYRLVHDYKQYVNDAIAAGRSIEPYPMFYEECVEEPTYFKRIVRPTSLDDAGSNNGSARLLGVRSFSEDRVSVQHRSGSVQPRNPAMGGVHDHGSDDHVDDKTVDDVEQPEVLETQAFPAEPVDRSQDSSVRLWLEKAPGAESPDLGTPVEHSSLMEVDDLQLDGQDISLSPTPLPTLSKAQPGQRSASASSEGHKADNSAELRKDLDRARRDVANLDPSPSLLERPAPTNSKPASVGQKPSQVQAQSCAATTWSDEDDYLQSSIHKSYAAELAQPNHATAAPISANPPSTKRPTPLPWSTPPTSSDRPRPPSANKPSAVPPANPPLKSSQPTKKTSKHLSAFDNFLTNYRNLPNEIPPVNEHGAKHGRRTIDVFSWRDS